MCDKPKILIIYAKYGEGHYQVARTMKDRLEHTGQFEVSMLDVFAMAHPLWNAWTRWAFHQGSIYCPKLYGWIYHYTNRIDAEGRLNRWIRLMGMERIKAIVLQENPDLVLHTFPFLAAAEMDAVVMGEWASMTIVTDYVMHKRWLHPNTDRYFVASEEMKAWMLAQGVPAHRINVSGIPIRASFLRKVSAAKVYRKYGLKEDKPIILMMAGANGVFTKVSEDIHHLVAHHSGEIVIVCGHNNSLYHSLRKQFKHTAQVHVVGFVESIEELMAVSSCLVTKAGGITLAEARAMGLPVIVYRPLPGQEQGNADYWHSRGFVRIIKDRTGLHEAVQQAISWKANKREDFAQERRSEELHAADIVVQEISQFMTTFARKTVSPMISSRLLVDN
ncbi:glycosyltransferase [Paenibacillus sp. PR3]|uniref:Glycosyltransferase n=1 Tax=Paenibacillus terricola TaxID=2763503 RepID=A0ABR8MWP9_9BACL|nr:glycosyltransferase [Paenibacillus terricola]MBD3919335.1 glycosyltransferase [Paenibacillus terricola]